MVSAVLHTFPHITLRHNGYGLLDKVMVLFVYVSHSTRLCATCFYGTSLWQIQKYHVCGILSENTLMKAKDQHVPGVLLG